MAQTVSSLLMRTPPSALLLAILRRLPASGFLPRVLSFPRILFDLLITPLVVTISLLASLLLPIQAQAQTLTADGLSWGVTKSGPDTATVSNGALAIASTFAVAATWYGVKNITPIGRVVTTAASVAGPIAANMLRSAQAAGKIAGTPAMLALALALGGANLNYDPGSNQFLSPSGGNKPNGSTVDYTSTGWWTSNQNFGRCSQASPCDAQTAAQTYADAYCPSGIQGACTVLSIKLQTGSTTVGLISVTRNRDGVVFNNIMSISRATAYTDPPATYVPSTDAQIATAASTPAALAKVWDAASDSDKDQLIGGGVPGTPTFPNGDTMQFPPRTTTGAGTDGQGRPMNGTFTMVPSVKVVPNTGADAIKNPVAVQPSQANTWSGTDAVGNPVSGTNTTTFPTQTAPPASQAGSGGTTVNVETCGLPGKPKCLIDETGTPGQSDVTAVGNQQTAALDQKSTTWTTDRDTQLQAVDRAHDDAAHIFDFFKIFPTFATETCVNPEIPGSNGGTLPVDICTYYYLLKDVTSFGVALYVLIDSIQQVRAAVSV